VHVLFMILPFLILPQLPHYRLASWGLTHHPTDVLNRQVEQIVHD
jgi:hypothetical protein